MEIFEDIYRQYQPDVYRFLLRLSGCDTQLADELTQETFYQAFLSFGRFRGECQMRTWLCQIAKHVYARHIRRELRQRQLAEHASEPPPNGEMLAQMEQKEQLLHIRQVVSRLDEPARSVVQYRLYSEMSYAEIARLMQMREGTAMVIFSRAKSKIRKILKEEYGYEI